MWSVWAWIIRITITKQLLSEWEITARDFFPLKNQQPNPGTQQTQCHFSAFLEILNYNMQHKSILKLHNKFIPFKNSLGFKSKQRLLSDRGKIELLLYATLLAITNDYANPCHQFHRDPNTNDYSCARKEKNKNKNIPKHVPSLQVLRTS